MKGPSLWEKIYRSLTFQNAIAKATDEKTQRAARSGASPAQAKATGKRADKAPPAKRKARKAARRRNRK